MVLDDCIVIIFICEELFVQIPYIIIGISYVKGILSNEEEMTRNLPEIPIILLNFLDI